MSPNMVSPLHGQPNMHRCLEIPELLMHIFEEVYLDVSGEPLSTLKTLALTCRIFSELALDVLWKSQLTIAPLVMTLPADAWELKKVRVHKLRAHSLRLTRPLVSQDWTRFDMYALRIKHLHSRPNSTVLLSHQVIDLDTTIFNGLATRHATLPMLPNLRQLGWSMYDWMLNFFPIYLSPSLSSLEVAIDQRNLSLLLFELARMKHTHASWSLLDFTIFDLDGICATAKTSDVLDLAPLLEIPLWQATTTFYIHPLSRRRLAFLARLPALQYTELRPSSDAIITSLASANLSSPFPSLRHLILRINSLSTCISLLACMTACRLESLEIALLPEEVPYEEFLAFTSGLAKCCSHDSLRILSLDYLDTPEKEIDYSESIATHTPIDAAALTPLFRFSRLESLSMSFLHLFAVDNAFLARVASAWPQLRALRLGSEFEYDAGSASQVTFAGLAALARGLPRLEALWLTVDITKDHLVPEDIAMEDVQAGGGALVLLSLANSKLYHATVSGLAGNLFALFPRIRDIRSNHETYLIEDGASEVHVSHYLKEVNAVMDALAAAAVPPVDRPGDPSSQYPNFRLEVPRRMPRHY